MADAVLAAVQPLLQEVAGFPLYVQVLVGVAALWAARWALCLAGLFFKFFLRPAKRVQQFGAWGVVTGATDGIGKALAVELARKGMNLVLMSRTQKRLEEVRDEIVAKYPKVQVEVLAVDFNNIDDPSERAAISKLLARLGDIGVLFNNVGVSYDFPQFFEQLPANRVDSLIKLNVTSSTVMTQLVLPGMLERKRGVVVNVSSGSGRLRVPLLAQYSATKKYVEQFTLCLADETRAKGVHVQCHVPMFVTTKLAKIRHPTFFVPSPAVYARASVAFLGRDTLVSPYWPHALQIWIYENVPQWLASKFAMMSHLSLRKRALKKLAAKKTE